MVDQINVLAAPVAAPGKAASIAKTPAPAQVWKRPQPSPTSRSPQFQKPNPATNAGGVPRMTGPGTRQLDGSRTATFEAPQKHPGMAERQPAPQRSAQQGGSGLESAMATLADQLHPRRQRPRS